MGKDTIRQKEQAAFYQAIAAWLHFACLVILVVSCPDGWMVHETRKLIQGST